MSVSTNEHELPDGWVELREDGRRGTEFRYCGDVHDVIVRALDGGKSEGGDWVVQARRVDGSAFGSIWEVRSDEETARRLADRIMKAGMRPASPGPRPNLVRIGELLIDPAKVAAVFPYPAAGRRETQTVVHLSDSTVIDVEMPAEQVRAILAAAGRVARDLPASSDTDGDGRAESR